MISGFEKEICLIAERIMSSKHIEHHGLEHVNRVVQYGKRIIREEGIGGEHLPDILAALYFHDIGRVDDSNDDTHGIRSAQMFEQEIHPLYPFLDLETIMFTMKDHQNYKPESGGYPVVDNYQINPGINTIVPIVMWDADRLDLPRIEKFRGRIDLNYLHTCFAKRFANSQEHLEIYEKL